MAIKPKSERKNEKEVIDLSGPQGNAYYLLAQAESYAKQLDLDFDKIEEEMKADDYEHLIKIFDIYFGDYVDLQR